jgi:hypothetical protein
MAQWGLGGRCVLMDMRNTVEPSGAMAASTVGAAKIMLILTLKIDPRLMVVTTSIVSTQGACHKSAKPDERSCFA